jgi:hypothetical protein
MVTAINVSAKYPVRNRAWSPLHDEDGFDGEYAAAYVAEASTLDHQLACPDCGRPVRSEGGLVFCTGKCGWSTGDPSEAKRVNKDPWNRPMPEMHAHHDREHEIVKWSGATTVEGQSILLVILND